MIFPDNSIVPVVMFHSVGLEDSNWSKRHLSEPVSLFQKKIKLLKKKGYEFFCWNQLYDYMQNSTKRSSPAIMLTFDDGYLDNWVYVFPILKNLKAKATIFVNPEFINPSNSPRPNLDDVWSGKLNKNQLSPVGFLNWAELKIMQKSGIIDIQSHALTHTWYFRDSKIVDFHNPRDNYPWLIWNSFVDRKYCYMNEDQRRMIPYGYPIFDFGKALVVKKYFPDEKFVQRIIDYVKKQGESLFDNPHWKDELFILCKKDRDKNIWVDSWESQENYEKRVYEELKDSKKILETELNKAVDFICWPGGGYNREVLAIASIVGYRSWTLASSEKSDHRNCPGSSPGEIKRISSMRDYKISRSRKQKDYGFAGQWYFLSAIERHKGSGLYKWFGRFLLMIAIFKSHFRRGG